MAPYSIKEDFDADTFTVNPEPFDVGGVGTLIAQGLICLFLLSTCTGMVRKVGDNNSSIGLVVWLICFAFCSVAFYVPLRRVRRIRSENDKERAEVDIHVGDKDLRVGSFSPSQIVIPYSNLHQLVVRNSLDGEYIGGSSGGFVAVGGTGIVAGAAMATTALLGGAANLEARARAVRRKKHMAVSFQLTAEAAGVSHVLVGGMTETAANGLMHDVSKRIMKRRIET